MTDNDKPGRHVYRVAVCSRCKVDVTVRGYKLCEGCLESMRQARAQNPDYRAKLIQRYRETGSLYSFKERFDLP